jgi:hypothetical protein
VFSLAGTVDLAEYNRTMAADDLASGRPEDALKEADAALVESPQDATLLDIKQKAEAAIAAKKKKADAAQAQLAKKEAAEAKAADQAAEAQRKIDDEKQRAQAKSAKEALFCQCVTYKRFNETLRDRELEAGKESGFVDKTKLHGLGENISLAKRMIKAKFPNRSDAECKSVTSITAIQQSSQACLMAMHAEIQDGNI